MAKKRGFPTKECPKCHKPIHARSQSHKDCGWEMKKTAPTAPKKKLGRPAGSKNKKVGRPAGSGKGGSVSLADIQAVKALTDRIGAAKVRELVEVLG